MNNYKVSSSGNSKNHLSGLNGGSQKYLTKKNNTVAAASGDEGAEAFQIYHTLSSF